MMAQKRWVILSVLLLAGVVALNMVLAVQGVVAHPETGRTIGTGDTGNETPNPHSDLIFRATGARSCQDCHGIGKNGVLNPRPIDNDLVKKLRDKAKGIHGPGRFADCLRCHAGGSKGVEKY